MSFNRIVRAGVIGSVLALSAGPGFADALDSKGLRILVAGKTIHLSAPFGSVPIRYSAGGTMSARSKSMVAYAGVAEDSGTWRISGNQICQRWNTWNNGKEQCFSVTLNGSTVRWRSSDGYSGTAYASN